MKTVFSCFKHGERIMNTPIGTEKQVLTFFITVFRGTVL